MRLIFMGAVKVVLAVILFIVTFALFYLATLGVIDLVRF